MKILALETSTQRGGAAIVVDGQILAEESSDRQRSHSELLHLFIERVLERSSLRLSDLDAFAVGQGPGSFTGLRVASSAAKTYACLFQKPLVAVDTLTQLAFLSKERSRPVLAMVNAFKNMVYYGIFDFEGDEPKLRGELAVRPANELDSLIAFPVTVVGDAFDAYQTQFSPTLKSFFHREIHPIDYPTAGSLGVLAERRLAQGRVFDWKAFSPLYLRASEAEENKRGALFKPL